MEDFWKGAFIGKHSDGLHGNYGGHMAAQQNQSLIDLLSDEPVYLDKNPISGAPINGTRPYYILSLTIDGVLYRYFIPGNTGGLKPTESQIESTLNAYNRTKTEETSDDRKEIVEEFGDGFEDKASELGV